MDKPGLELLYAHVSKDINGPEDALVCVLHWHIISNGFKCTGAGEKVNLLLTLTCYRSYLFPCHHSDNHSQI